MGVVTTSDSGEQHDGRILKLAQQLESLTEACERHFADTGSYGHEYNAHPPQHRKLSATQSTEGWNGPYISQALSPASNPWGSCHLYRHLQTNENPGFDLDADGELESIGPGNAFYLAGVPQEEARRLDTLVDASLGGQDWASSGRLNWLEGDRVFVFLYR
ncbi:MAG: hypothetical protein ACI841_004314 [Planctomycetota bacterium]|jgi:hypothetical protein